MKLRNKKTGEIVCSHNFELFRDPNNIVIGEYEYSSLAQLNEEWQDYEEQCWYITSSGEVREGELDADWRDERRIGNYFESKDDAKKAVEKLKAWKRLKDRGYKFKEWFWDENYGTCIIIGNDECDYVDDTDEQNTKDLDLLFGGEE